MACAGGCSGDCSGDCECMKERVASRFLSAALKKPLLVLENKDDGFEVHVIQYGDRFHVVLFDPDAEEYFPSPRIYPTLERAEAEAKKIVRGDGPSGHARLASAPSQNGRHVQATAWEKKKELEWEYRQEVNRERNSRRRQEMLREQETRLKREWSALSEAEKADAREEMEAHHKKVELWRDLIEDWDERKKRIDEDNKAKKLELAKRRIKQLEDIGKEMRSEGWEKFDPATARLPGNQGYRVELPSEKMDRRGNALLYVGYLAITSDELFLKVEVQGHSYTYAPDGTLVTLKPESRGDYIFDKSIRFTDADNLDALVDKGQAVILGAIEKHRRSMPDLPDSNEYESDPRHPGPTPSQPKVWGWQKKLENRLREEDGAKRLEEKAKQKAEEDEAANLREIGKEFKQDGWQQKTLSGGWPGEYAYNEPPYSAVVNPEYGKYDTIRQWHLVVQKDGQKIYTRAFADHEGAIQAARGVIEKDRRGLGQKPPAPPPASPGAAPGNNADVIKRLMALSEASKVDDPRLSAALRGWIAQLRGGKSWGDFSEKQRAWAERSFPRYKLARVVSRYMHWS